MFVVVTTFYTLEGMKSILLPKFVFCRSRLRLSLKNTNLLFYCFICFLWGVALRIITYRAPFTQGSLNAERSGGRDLDKIDEALKRAEEILASI